MSIGRFVHEGPRQRVLFGEGTLTELAGEVERLGLQRVLVLSTSGREAVASRVAALLHGRCAGIFAKARMHTPVDVTGEALQAVARARADGTVAVGGGTAIGLGKAIAARTGLTLVAIPTTYAGSEATTILGETAAGTKRTTRNPAVLPRLIVYDVDLTLTLPLGTSVSSALNGVAHAVEGLYARHATPALARLAEDGIRALGDALPRLASDPADRAARSAALYGAWRCGTVLGRTSMALHHKLCHVLGGTFDLPHSETHAIVLPHVAAFNRSAAPDAMARAATALGVGDAAGGLFDLARLGGGPSSLCDLGLQEGGLDRAADLVVADSYWNPKPVTRDAVRALLDDAWHGVRPGA